MSTDSIEASFHFRHFAPESDFSRMLLLLREVEATDQAGEDVTEETQRGLMAIPGHDPALDRWAVEDPANPDRLIGFALVWKPPHAEHADTYIAVHPGWRRRGIGSALLDRLLQRARVLQAISARAYASERHAEATSFLRQRDFSPVAAYTEMRLPANTPISAPGWPDGYHTRKYDPATDFQAWLDGCNRGYQGLWGHREVDEEEMKSWFPGYTLDGAFLLYGPRGDVVGVCRSEISAQLSERRGTRTGWVDAPGVVPEQRDKGLYLPLLLTALHWIRSQENIPVELESWGDSEETLNHYQQIGFTPTRKEISYRRDLA